jgi:peroxiredoxin
MAIEAGKQAPMIQLPLVAGGSFSLADALTQGPVVLAFFKISCPVCQFTFPYLERIHKAAGGKVQVIGVSQNLKEQTEPFLREYGITFPVLLDDAPKYPVSNAYGLTNVPSTFYIGKDQEIAISSVGWAKDDLLKIAHKISEEAQLADIQVIQPGEEVPAYRAG